MTTATETKPFDVEVCVGCVMVYVPVYDGDGKMRSIDFSRPEMGFGSGVNYHWTCKPYMAKARQLANAKIRQLRTR